MGIRDTSYYGWRTLDVFAYFSASGYEDSVYTAVKTDVSGNIYCGGYAAAAPGTNRSQNTGIIRRSADFGSTWTTIDSFFSSSSNNKFNYVADININVSGAIYAVGRSAGAWIVRKSHITSSTFWSTVDISGSDTSSESTARGVAFDSNNNVYVVGGSVNDSAMTSQWYIRRSTDAGLTWNNVDVAGSTSDLNKAYGIVLSGTVLFVAGYVNDHWLVKSSADGTTWGNGVDIFSGTVGGIGNYASSVCVTPSGKLFVAGNANGHGLARSSSEGGITGSWGSCFSLGSTIFNSIKSNDNGVYVASLAGTLDWRVAHSPSGITSSWRVVDYIADGKPNSALAVNTDGDNIYVAGQSQGSSISFRKASVRLGKLTANSASLGPRMLATSFGFVRTEISGTITEGFNLNNVSEFPHSSGLFQMPNLVLGTKSQGRAGKTDDAIVQKRFIGSFVRILFPRQDTDQDIKGYDAGRKPGKLTTDWQFGDPINIENKQFDSLALNCYASVLSSGTMDAVLVRIETKGLNDLGFTIDQTTEQTISSSFASEAVLRDDIIRKNIDYGDTSLSEISWKISVDLKNVKEIRLAAKQRNGQSDDKNKQVLVVGRFVKSSKDTEEV